MSGRHVFAIALVVPLGFAGLGGAALAQGNGAAPGRADSGQSDRTAPKSLDQGLSGSSSEPLSDRLDRSDGVIRPPARMDPGMTQKPPAAGRQSTPVIPPPGTGGNKPSLDPK